jgi:MurNAc alpha-1-phosphate uridylyltransferase
MRAMILAAGRGERMQHLTMDTPKALLRLHGRYLIEYSISALVKAGVEDIVINVCYKAEQIKAALGDGSRYGVNIIYSDEVEALETGGGIFQALPLLGDNPFIVLSCDVISDYHLQNLPREPKKLAHLVMVNNPEFHPKGDFCFHGDYLDMSSGQTYTFSNIGIYRPELFAGCQPGRFRLGELLRVAIDDVQVTGERYTGFWMNLGTPSQLESMAVLPDSLP